MSASENKVYVILTDLNGASWPEAVRKTFELERDIANLAKKSAGEDVHFHLELTAFNAPVVLLECSEKFLGEVKKLAGFGSVQPLPTNVQTIRRSKLPQVEAPEAQRPGAKPKPSKGPFGI